MKVIALLATLVSLSYIASAQKTFSTTEDVRFSPDGKQVIFSSVLYEASTSSGVPAKRLAARIALMNIDGTNFKYITPETMGVADASPVLSADGKKILFRRDNLKAATEPGDIFVINSDGTGLIQLSKKTEQETSPEFSLDGKGAVFVREYFAGMGKAREGELVYVSLNGTQEKILVSKEMRVAQAIPISIGRGGYLLACAETDGENKPVPAGSMLVMASPDGEISPKSKMLFQGKDKIRIMHVRMVVTEGKPIFYVAAREGEGWFAEDVNFKVAGGQTQKLTGRGYYSDISLSPDGKMGTQGGDSASSVDLWDFSEDKFSNKRILFAK